MYVLVAALILVGAGYYLAEKSPLRKEKDRHMDNLNPWVREPGMVDMRNKVVVGLMEDAQTGLAMALQKYTDGTQVATYLNGDTPITAPPSK